MFFVIYRSNQLLPSIYNNLFFNLSRTFTLIKVWNMLGELFHVNFIINICIRKIINASMLSTEFQSCNRLILVKRNELYDKIDWWHAYHKNECLLFYSKLSDDYQQHIYPYMVPIMLPVAQISMTASVYMTVVTCFDR